MDIAPACIAAKKYAKADKEAGIPALIRFAPGRVFAQGPDAGVVIDCPAVTWAGSGDAAQIVAMARKAGKTPEYSFAARTLTLRTAGGTFRLQLLDDKAAKGLPSAPNIPATFRSASAEVARALDGLARVAYPTDDDPTFTALRLAPSWAAVTRGTALAVVWLVDGSGAPLGLVSEALSIDAQLLKGVKGATGFAATKAFLWAQSGDVHVWGRRRSDSWPDDVVSGDNLAKLREATALPLPADLDDLLSRARAAADSAADAFTLTWSTDLALHGGGRQGTFRGAVAAAAPGDGRSLGVCPDVWALLLRLVSSCDSAYLALPNEATKPAVLWGVSPVAVETFVWPAYVASR